MMLGIGDTVVLGGTLSQVMGSPVGSAASSTTNPLTSAAGPGFMDGLKLWMTPSAAFTALQNVASNASTAFSSANISYTAGVIAPPVLLLVFLMGAKHR